jgi:hypothetical protein
LPVQGHVAAAGVAARWASRLTVEHQREQAECLGLLRQEPRDEPAEPDRLFGETSPLRIRPGNVVPAAAEGGVDRFQDRVDALTELTHAGDLERDPGVTDLRLCPDEPLAHRPRRHEERRRDTTGVESEHGLQHQRRARRRLDSRMRADEEQLQTLVGENRIVGFAARAFSGQELQGGRDSRLDLRMP